MASARFPAMKTHRGFKGFDGGAPKGSLLHNDDSHNFSDMNQGGGPHGMRNKPSISQHDRSGAGTGASGQRTPPQPGGATRPSAGNPASRGGFNGEARGGSFQPESRIPGHGGSPQHREREIPGDFHKRGGVGAQGQDRVPGGHQASVRPPSGNVGGTSYRMIAGRFKRAAMGARPNGAESRGAYGGAPVTSNT